MHPNAAAHEAAGATVTTPAGEVFYRSDGDGPPAVCVHGVPTSSYLYRKVLPLLAANGMRAIAPDLIGLGLSTRPSPSDFDYSFAGLSHGLEATVDALGLGRFHLVVHDIGGPVGFHLATRQPDRIASLVVLNSWIDLNTFRQPWPMWLFAKPAVDRVALATLRGPLAYLLFQRICIAKRAAFTLADARAYVDLVKHGDGGASFLAIMRSFERSLAVRERLEAGLAAGSYPALVLWGRHDPAIGAARAAHLHQVLGRGDVAFLEAKHFLTEDHAPQVAEHILRLSATAEP